jgi:hypothetical protein
MENEISKPFDWIAILINLVFFFGIVIVTILPAIKFRSLAKRNREKGWLFFVVGLGVGLLGLALGRVFISWVNPSEFRGFYSSFSAGLFFVPPIVIYLIFYRLLKKNIEK